MTDKENQPLIQVQVRNIKLGIVTFWNLDKLEYKLAAMKDLYEVIDKLNASMSVDIIRLTKLFSIITGRGLLENG